MSNHVSVNRTFATAAMDMEMAMAISVPTMQGGCPRQRIRADRFQEVRCSDGVWRVAYVLQLEEEGRLLLCAAGAVEWRALL